MKNLNSSIKSVAGKLIKELPERSQDIIVSRFGLGSDGESMTLESIGGKYGITRERVRQIEGHGLSKIRASATMAHAEPIFVWLKNELDRHHLDPR